MKQSVVLLMVLVMLFPVIAQQKKIVEEVSVQWWVVPVFAIDNDGQSILDLTEKDVVVKVDGRKLENFTLVKRSFTASQQEEKKTGALKPKIQRTKNVFLLFDTALSTRESTEVAKLIALKIVQDAEADTRFFIMTIEPFAGLSYAGGQTSDKNVLAEIITRKVKPKKNSRVPSPNEIMNQMGGMGGGKYSASEIEFFRGMSSKYYKRKSSNFNQSFETLYYALNNIKDNKFVYLFSEGVSNAIQAEAGDRSLFEAQLAQVADYLGRSGAVLFVVNPFGATSASNARYSGEDSLRFLADKSGGKYLEGSDQKILENIGNIHQAYYEIFFPASPRSTKGVLRISVVSARSGVDVHTLQATEKSRKYSQMKDMEREVLALNLVSGNPLYRTGLAVDTVTPEKKIKKGKVTYKAMLPDPMVGRSLDLYKITLVKKGEDIADTRVEKKMLHSRKRSLTVTFNNVNVGEETYFAVVDGAAETAVVHGIQSEQEKVFRLTLADEVLDMEQWATKDTIQKDMQTQNPDESTELARLLKGAANYCERLKVAAFHYICNENIYENQRPLKRSRNVRSDASLSPQQPGFGRASGWVDRQKIKVDKIYSPVFSYRLIKQGTKVTEERELVKAVAEAAKGKKKKKKKSKTGEAVPKTKAEALRGIRFVSSKSVFGPITLLAADRQGKYHFKLLERKTYKDRPVAILEAYPRSEKDTMFVYGKIWLDTENFSVLKIKANPNSLVGYNRLQQIKEELGSRLFLTLETEFLKFRDGIRFPTRIHFVELYRGGAFITDVRGSRGWKRTENVTRYTDFMFFDVKSDVTYQQ